VTFYAPPSDLETVFFVSPVDGHHMVSIPLIFPPWRICSLGPIFLFLSPLMSFM
jgi:hypothetical protein